MNIFMPFSKKQIFILSILFATISIFSIFLIFSSFNQGTANLKKQEEKRKAEEIFQVFPTGIIIPTSSINQNDLDIISISPNDGQINVKNRSIIEIKFSRKPTSEEIKFFINPKINFNQEIVDNSIKVLPVENFIPGTLYTISINFKNDKEKIRMYKFISEGEINVILPDTREEDVIKDFENQQLIEFPDIYVANKTPFETPLFSVVSEYEPVVPSRYYLIITPKSSNREDVESSVFVWLQSLGLTSEQINNLDIRYL